VENRDHELEKEQEGYIAGFAGEGRKKCNYSMILT
jgi:ribosome modulation factor